MKRLLLIFILVNLLSGCMALPVVAMANMAHKSGTMTITLEGRGDALKAFREAAIRSGGTVPMVTADFARAEFSNVDIKVEAQLIPGQAGVVTLRSSSMSNLGRTYELKDNMTEIPEQVALAMQSAGFVVKSKHRDRGL